MVKFPHCVENKTSETETNALFRQIEIVKIIDLTENSSNRQICTYIPGIFIKEGHAKIIT